MLTQGFYTLPFVYFRCRSFLMLDTFENKFVRECSPKAWHGQRCFVKVNIRQVLLIFNYFPQGAKDITVFLGMYLEKNHAIKRGRVKKLVSFSSLITPKHLSIHVAPPIWNFAWGAVQSVYSHAFSFSISVLFWNAKPHKSIYTKQRALCRLTLRWTVSS